MELLAFPQLTILCWRSFHIHLRGLFFSSSITPHVAAAAASATSAAMCKYREEAAFKPSAAPLLPSKARHRLHELGDLT